MRHIWGTLLSKLSGKAHLILTRFSVRRWNTSQDSDSCVDSDARTTWEGWNSQSSYTPASSVESIPKWDPDMVLPSIEPPKPLPTISFSAPLAPAEGLVIGCITISPQCHPFLASFLYQPRYTDIPFGIAHRLLGYIMHLLEEAAFDFVTLHTPENKTIGYGDNRSRWAYSADEFEIQWWIRHINKSDSLQRHLAGALCNELEDFRNSATHSWVYDSWQFRAAVAFLAKVGDETRLTRLEEILQTVYRRTQALGEYTITDKESEATDMALGLIRTEPVTFHQVFCRVQELLEKACFDFWVEHNPQRLTGMEWHFSDNSDRSCVPPGVTPIGWDCPERVELQRWRPGEIYGFSWNFEQFPTRGVVYDPDVVDEKLIGELLSSVSELRNMAGHRDHRPARGTAYTVLADAVELADELGDRAAADEIEELRHSPLLSWIYHEQQEDTDKELRWREEREERALREWKRPHQILEDSLLLHRDFLACETPSGECATT